MNTFESKEVGATEDVGLTDKQKFRRLAKLFHTDVGGDKALMIALNVAKEELENKKPEKLQALYKEWAGDKSEKDTTRTKKEKIRLIEEDLLAFSNELFENIRSGNRGKSLLFAAGSIRSEYYRLCEEAGVKRDREFIEQFLFDQGWITEENFAKGKNINLWA
ncbi:MAG: hypothetical protein ABII97_02290 [Patescibacteria group bacterium]